MLKLTVKKLKNSFIALILILQISCTEDPAEPIDGVDGFNALVEVQNENPGDNCSLGGVRISVGQDVNVNGILDEAEIVSVSFICNGANSESSSTLVVRTSPENPGEDCANGGTLIEIGADVNSNNSLDDNEVQTSFYVCNGQDGSNGESGGTDGLTSLIRVFPSSTCSNGGITIEIGLDANSNQDLDPDEIDASYDICNGINGANGDDGLSTLSNITIESPGLNCENGGLKIELGIDTDQNGFLDNDEVVSENYICNGVDGSDGSNGNNSLITVSSFSGSQGGCTSGGLIIRSGIDDNGNGVLNNEEIDATAYVCNGDDGTNGSDGNSDGILEFYFQEGFDAYTGVLDASITDKNPAEIGESLSVDRGSTDSHGLIQFPGLESLGAMVGEEFQIVEAILYLRGLSGRVDGQTQGNWIGVKTLLSSAPLFEEDAVSWTTANSNNDTWSIGGVASQDDNGDANGYSDMFQLPATGNFEFDGYIPLQLNISEVTAWTDANTGKDNNKGLVLLMADNGIQYELDIYTSNYSKDNNYRPLLYLKVKTGIKGRLSSISEKEYRSNWKSMTYEEKLAPLKRITD
ncbi:hypothetical protein [Ekhidna sp.]|uniref:DUF7151 family protein n=1 Tax=Ekhidna sp. TaxID=2608089 RepID=UPI0032973E9C